MLKYKFCIITLLLCSTYLIGQNSSNVYVVDVSFSGSGKYEFSNPLFITDQNKNNYNNQPQFADSLLLISSDRGDDQTDIYCYDLISKTEYKLTQSRESEFSPTLMPNGDHISFIQVSADSNRYQQLWKIPTDLSSEPELVMDKVFRVGYHSWIADTKVLLFIVGSPRHLLQLYDTDSQTFESVAQNIGRCLQLSPAGNPSYVDKSFEDRWYLKLIDKSTLRSIVIAETLEGSEDFIWTPSGEIIMGKGSLLYALNASEANPKWRKIADFSHWGILNIKRLALGNGKLAIVTSTP